MIAIIEDDKSIRELVCYTLNNTGFDAIGFDNSKPFYEHIKQQKPQLLLLDIMLPDEDGISILKKLKASPATKDIPVIMLTAKDSEYDKVMTLDCGADDYVTKPFGIMELISRIKAVLRRSPNKIETKLKLYNIEMDTESRTITQSGKEILLTLKEYELLKTLLENKGRVMTRELLLENIWGYDFDGETRTVDVHIRSLRNKLSENDIIETVRGIGYKVGDKK
ncbi:MAG: response regulator transcription factor [Synergistaceae bacterium]